MKNNLFSFRAVCMSLLLMVGMTAYAQLTVQGTVIDIETGEPVIGASILEMGTTNGTITDFDGNFTLNVQPGAKLQFSYMGYKTQELAAQQSMYVRMGEDSELLDEVVVVGYGVVKKNDATGSVTAIKPDDMNKGLQTSAQDMLQGKIAGVNVTTSGGAPNGGATIRIRGGSSLTASNDPLIVIDGLAMDNNGMEGGINPLALVNPNDIETFTVLKDASATAIYGSRASNGVILITTKKGKSGSKLKVTYDGNVSFGTVIKHTDVMNADELRAYTMSAGRDHLPYLMNDNVDWFSHIYRTAISTDHNVSLAGGFKDKNVDMPYRVSVGYTLNNGAVKGSQMQRVTGSLNLSPSFLDNHLSFNLNAKGMYIYNEFEPDIANAYLGKDPTQPIYSDGNLTNIYGEPITVPNSGKENDYITKEELDTHWGGYFQPLGSSPDETGPNQDPEWMYSLYSAANPLSQLAYRSKKSHAGQFLGNLDATYKVHGFEDLIFHANFGADYSFSRYDENNNPLGPNHYTISPSYTQKKKYNLQFNCYAQYGHDWEKAQQHFDIMAGYEWQHFHNDYANESFVLYPETYLGTAAVPGEWTKTYEYIGKGENFLVSFFGRLNWIGWNQIMVTATLRADGSSRFPKRTRWGLFPSVAVGWKIKESFLKDVNWINDLKLRLGYGVTGQQEGIGDFEYLPVYKQVVGHTSYYPVGGENSYAHENRYTEQVDIVRDSLQTPLYAADRPEGYNMNLRWEQTTTYNVGLDFAFLNNRISGSVDYYFRKTTDLLNRAPAVMGTNFKSEIVQNIGSLQNQGVEFSINAVALDYGKRFKWDIGYNFTWNENKITKINGVDRMTNGGGRGGVGLGGGSIITKYAVGYPTNVFYLYQAQKGIKEDGTPYWYVIDQQQPGEEGYGEIGPEDQIIINRSPVAPFTMGFQMKFQFYGFDLGMSFRANIGNYVFNNVIASKLASVPVSSMLSGKYATNIPTSVFDVFWNDHYHYLNNGSYQAGITDIEGKPVSGDVYSITDRFLENASFLRCDNITLGYSFTTPKVSGRAYCTVSNPFVITKYSGLDPEIGTSGVDNTIYPRSMTTVLGINLQF